MATVLLHALLALISMGKPVLPAKLGKYGMEIPVLEDVLTDKFGIILQLLVFAPMDLIGMETVAFLVHLDKFGTLLKINALAPTMEIGMDIFVSVAMLV
jgi:hypothetical protein